MTNDESSITSYYLPDFALLDYVFPLCLWRAAGNNYADQYAAGSCVCAYSFRFRCAAYPYGGSYTYTYRNKRLGYNSLPYACEFAR